MNYAALALGLAFAALGVPFLAKAKTESDPQQQRALRLAADRTADRSDDHRHSGDQPEHAHRDEPAHCRISLRPW